jgi:Flp pilus assembly protein TadG
MNTVLQQRGSQQGTSAIEFALVLPIFLLMLYGLVTFGFALYTQMVVSRAAEDAVRAVSSLTSSNTYAGVNATTKSLIKNEVINSLANSTIAPGANNASYATRRTWLVNNVLTTIVVDNSTCGGGAGTASTLRVSYTFPFSAALPLPVLDLPGPIGSFSAWMPTNLKGCALVQL